MWHVQLETDDYGKFSFFLLFGKILKSRPFLYCLVLEVQFMSELWFAWKKQQNCRQNLSWFLEQETDKDLYIGLVEVSLFLLHYYIEVLLLDTSTKCNLSPSTCIFNGSNCYWLLDFLIMFIFARNNLKDPFILWTILWLWISLLCLLFLPIANKVLKMICNH